VSVLGALVLVGCGGGSRARGAPPAGGQSSSQAAGGSRTIATADQVRIAITPSNGTDRRPDRGLRVTATGGTLISVRASNGKQTVPGAMNRARTDWHSTWALGVGENYTVNASGAAPSGAPVTKTVSFHTFTPKQTFVTRTVEGYHQTYGVGMPIILYFDHTIAKPHGDREGT
jgi:hypothetical protein